MQPMNGQYLSFKGQSVLSQSDAKTLPREARIQAIATEMKKVGFTSPKVSYLFDKYSDTVLKIYSHQFELMNEYKALLDNHKDVTSFLKANEDKDKTELALAAEEFDLGASNNDEKIGPKLARYEAATEKIWQENAKLSLQIAAQAAELGAVFYTLHRSDRKRKEQKAEQEANNPSKKQQKDDELSNLQKFVTAELFSMLSSANRTYDAYKLAEIRLHLAKVANEFITDEQAVIDISKQLQAHQNAQ